MGRYFRNLTVYEIAWVKINSIYYSYFSILRTERFIQNLVVCENRNGL